MIEASSRGWLKNHVVNRSLILAEESRWRIFSGFGCGFWDCLFTCAQLLMGFQNQMIDRQIFTMIIINNHHYHAPAAKANKLFRSLATVEQWPVVLLSWMRHPMKVLSLHLPRTASCVFGEGCETWFPVCWAAAALRPIWGWSRCWRKGTAVDFAEDVAIWFLRVLIFLILWCFYTVLHCFLKLVSSSPKKWWLLGCTPWLTGLQRDKEYRGALPADAFGDFLPQTPQIRLQVTMNPKFMLSQSWFKGTSAGFTPTFGVQAMVSCRCCHPVMRQNHLSIFWKRQGGLYVCIRTENHVISDGWSNPLMLQEAVQFYTGGDDHATSWVAMEPLNLSLDMYLVS